jgi:hypothetical protein
LPADAKKACPCRLPSPCRKCPRLLDSSEEACFFIRLTRQIPPMNGRNLRI